MSDPSGHPIIYIVDDDASLLRSLSRLLAITGHLVQTFTSAHAFLAHHQLHHRGCVVADLHMPELGGLELQRVLLSRKNPLPIIFLTGNGDIPSSVKAIKDGAEDFLTKPVTKEQLMGAVKRALARDAMSFKQNARGREVFRRFESLTPRECEVLALVVAGKMNKEIAADLGASENTIKVHRGNLMEKMQIQSPAELGRIIQEFGLFSRRPD